MADIIATLLGLFRLIFGFFLLLFIPGCAISFIFYPGIRDIPWIKRIVLSCVISIGSTLCAILFLDLVLGVDTTPVNSTIIILFISALACLIWGIRKAFSSTIDKQKKRVYFSKDL
jgi:uncharacterized membrane protein